jgi:hypothetical protein
MAHAAAEMDTRVVAIVKVVVIVRVAETGVA